MNDTLRIVGIVAIGVILICVLVGCGKQPQGYQSPQTRAGVADYLSEPLPNRSRSADNETAFKGIPVDEDFALPQEPYSPVKKK